MYSVMQHPQLLVAILQRQKGSHSVEEAVAVASEPTETGSSSLPYAALALVGRILHCVG